MIAVLLQSVSNNEQEHKNGTNLQNEKENERKFHKIAKRSPQHAQKVNHSIDNHYQYLNNNHPY